MATFRLYKVTPDGLAYRDSYDSPEKAMGVADAYTDETNPEWHYTAPNDTRWYRIWTRDVWYIQEEKS